MVKESRSRTVAGLPANIERMRVQLDRFEDNGWAIMLNYPAGNKTFDLPREALPKDATPGDVFDVRFEPDRRETARLVEENQRLMNELLERGE